MNSIVLRRKIKQLNMLNWKLIGFYILSTVLFINIVIMTLHLIDSNYKYKIFNHAYIEAVLPNQDISKVMKTGIVRIKNYKLETLEIETQVVICCDYQIDIPWVEQVVDKNLATKEVETTYDGVVSNTIDNEDVYGVYIKKANIIGTIYYSASFLKGYLYLVTSHIFIAILYYIILLRKKTNK